MHFYKKKTEVAEKYEKGPTTAIYRRTTSRTANKSFRALRARVMLPHSFHCYNFFRTVYNPFHYLL